MSQFFTIKSSEIWKIHKLYKTAPRKMRGVTAKIINDLAFKTRDTAILTLNKKLSIKQKKFVSGSIRVKKTTASLPLRLQSAIVGSITRPRFSGFAEQELGKKTKRTRVATLHGRGRNPRGTILSGYRLRPGKRFIEASDYPGKNQQHRTTVMLNTLARQKYKKPFVIKKHKKFPPGLYKFFRRKIILLQGFKPDKLQPKRVEWLTVSGRQVLQTTSLGAMFARSLKKIFRS